MTDFRRHDPEPIAGPPRIQHVPGMAAEMMADLAPLLAEEGIDVNNIDVPDMATLQAAMSRAIERREMQRLTPIGAARDAVASVLRSVAAAIQDGDTRAAAEILDAVPPEAEAGATVSAVIGFGAGRLDEWFAGTGPDRQAPARLHDRVRLPGGHWVGERAATDLLALARKGRAFDNLGVVIAGQGGYHVLFGTALAVTASLQAWSQLTGTALKDLAEAHLR
jgi:hypothetical protein